MRSPDFTGGGSVTAAQSPETETGGGAPQGGRAPLLPNDTNPVALNAAAVLSGFQPRPLLPGFTWAAFGCKDGFDTVLAAAAHPDGHFFGFDQDPLAISKAKTLAEAVYLNNVDFQAVEYRALSDTILPDLDFVIIADVISRVDAETRARVLGLAAQALKPGGILLVDYHALPGWAAQAPLRDLLFSLTADRPDPVAKAQKAIDWLREMRAVGARYFRDNPAIAQGIDALLAKDTRALQHAYFDGAIQPFHHAQISAELAAMGLSFAGRAELFLNLADFAVATDARASLRGAKSRAEFEAKRDFLRNESHRRDVFVKGVPFVSEAAWQTAQQSLVVGCALDPMAMERTINFGDVMMDFAGDPFDAVLSVIGQSALPVAVVMDAPEVEAHPPVLVLEAIRLLLSCGLVRPFAQTTLEEDAHRAPTDRLTVEHPLNRLLIERAPQRAHPCPLVSKALGGPVILSDLDAILLDALCLASQQPDTPAIDHLMIRMAGRTDAETLSAPSTKALFTDRLTKFETSRLPKLLELGIVTANPS